MSHEPRLPRTLLAGDEASATGVREKPPPPPEPRAASVRMPPRYEDLGHLAEGGSGEVRRVRDLRVDRPLVMKILDGRHLDAGQSAPRRRFDNEAHVTASLEHPGVVPVYDRGTLPDGRPWFTMKEVRGETFATALRQLEAEPPEARRAERRRLVEALLRVAETVGYAHSRGVAHRDLKPANLMRGAFGQVYVMDWGVAKTGIDPVAVAAALEAMEDDAGLELELSSELDERLETRAGDVLGTVPYMAPEQARGHAGAVGPASDVWALGLVLYEILAGERAFPGPAARVWGAIARGTTPELPARVTCPRELRALVVDATRSDARARLPDASHVAERLRRWLAGEARREQAREMLAAADGHGERLRALRSEENEKWAEARRLLGPLHANDPDEARWLLGWRAEDRALAARDAAEDVEAEVLQLLRAALQHDPENAEAHGRLATLARREVLDAEARGEPREVKRWMRMLAQHDDGTHAPFLAGMGEVALTSEPSGAEVALHRFVEEDRCLVPRPLEDGLERTPFRRTLPAGSYLAVLRAPGRTTVRYPFTVERAGVWDTVPPGEALPRPVRLPPVEAIGPEECFVPAGWTVVGEPEARGEAYARTRVWVEDLVVARHVVRLREYLAYLRALQDTGDDDALEAAMPRRPTGEWADVRLSAEGRVEVDPEMTLNPVVLGETPVRQVSFGQVEAYVAWRAARDRTPWRLPTDVEWEKSARGVDGRAFPWGRTLVGRWAVTADHDPPGLMSVDAAPQDESPYGVRHVAGNVYQLTATAWRLRPTLDAFGRVVQWDSSDDRELRSARGSGYYADATGYPLSRRFAVPPEGRYWSVGFRLVRDLGPG